MRASKTVITVIAVPHWTVVASPLLEAKEALPTEQTVKATSPVEVLAQGMPLDS